MIGFYSHKGGNFVWVLEVIGVKNSKEVTSYQYVPNGKCPIHSDTYIDSLITDDPEWDTPYWSSITEDEAKIIIGNLDEQKKELSYRLSEENIKWAQELAAVLNKVSGLTVREYEGVVRIDSKSGEFSITKNKDGKMDCTKTGFSDPGW